MIWCVLPWVQLLWDSLSFLDFLEVYFLCQMGKFSLVVFSNKLSISCSSSSPSGTPIIQMLGHLKLSQRFLSLSSIFFFEFLFLHSVLLECLFLPSVPNHRLESWFPSLHCWFPVYFLYFTLHSLHFFLFIQP